jgi:1-phosphatidylinositol-3-phosphate 5-kinase
MGGKSNSEFAKSQDELLVIKSIKPDEFDEFLKFASDYLKHLRAINRDSFLTKVYGIYEVVIKGDSYKYVVMQNLFLGF